MVEAAGVGLRIPAEGDQHSWLIAIMIPAWFRSVFQAKAITIPAWSRSVIGRGRKRDRDGQESAVEKSLAALDTKRNG